MRSFMALRSERMGLRRVTAPAATVNRGKVLHDMCLEYRCVYT